MAIQHDLRAIGSLAADSIEQLAKLIQNEAELAKTEIGAKVSDALRGVAYLAAATLFITPAIVMLLLALAQWMVTQGMSSPAAYALAAIVGLGVGLILALIGIQRLKPENLTPDVTMKEIRRDIAAAEEITPMKTEDFKSQYLKSQGSALLDDVNAAVRDNPVAAGLIGLGAAWFLFGGARSIMPSSLMPSMDAVSAAGRRSAQAVTDNVKSVGATAMKVAQDTTDAATTGVRSIADQAKDGFAEVASQTSQRADEMRDYASDASQKFMNTSSDLLGQTQANLRDAFERQPLLIGVIGAAVGIGIASAFPRTRLETEWMGDASASARKTAETLATEAGNVAKRVTEAVSHEAQAQGLTTDGLKDAARSTRDKLGAVGAAATDKLRQ